MKPISRKLKNIKYGNANMQINPDSYNKPVAGETLICFLSNPYTAQVVPIKIEIKGNLPWLKIIIRLAVNINITDITLLIFSFSFKKKKPKTTLIIGVKK